MEGEFIFPDNTWPFFQRGNFYQVEQAVREIKRLLIEASAAALQAEMRNPTATSGRYSVL